MSDTVHAAIDLPSRKEAPGASNKSQAGLEGTTAPMPRAEYARPLIYGPSFSGSRY